ncbi:MAG: carbohydrate kinase [Kiritimatiellae bacterium]|nr:carbohydrate kinase [Kiritimatiellia bacterium]
MTLKPDRVREIMARFAGQRILVVGDLMLDRYIYGNVERISPEAPVPVVQVADERNMPGGASNVAWNIRSLGAAAAVAGFVGQDQAAADLHKLLAERGISLDSVLPVVGSPTIVKTRIIAERQQVVRVDWDGPLAYPHAAVKSLCDRLVEEVAGATGVVIEDYGKGVIRQEIVDAVLQAAGKAHIPCGLDPKDNHELHVDGIGVATPNRKEAYVAAGAAESKPLADPLQDAKLQDVGKRLLAKWKPQMLVITLGPHGMLLLEQNGAAKHIPTRAREVFDVSGAGDTVIATCVLALAAGASHVEAVELANYAAGVVVGKLGTASCTREELLDYMKRS